MLGGICADPERGPVVGESAEGEKDDKKNSRCSERSESRLPKSRVITCSPTWTTGIFSASSLPSVTGINGFLITAATAAAAGALMMHPDRKW